MPQPQKHESNSPWSRTRVTAVLVAMLAIVLVTAAFGRPLQGTPGSGEPPLFIVSVYPYGFESDEMSVPAGPCSVMVRDLTGVEQDLNFSISVPGYPVPITYQLQHLQESVEHVTLVPGVYRITEATHPEWHCQVTVTP